MGKMTKYLLFLTVVILLFHFSGAITSTTPTGYLMDSVGITNPESIGTSTFYGIIIAIFVAALAGVYALIVYKVNPIYIYSVPLVMALIAILWDLVTIYSIISRTSYALATLIISPLMVVYLLAVFDWWRSSGET